MTDLHSDDVDDDGFERQLDQDIERVAKAVEAKIERSTIEDEENQLVKPPPARRRRKRNDGAVEMHELDAQQAAERRGEPIPEPEEVVKDIGLLCDKYRVGSDPEFSLEVHRLHPKYLGSQKIDGFLDQFQMPFDRSFLQDKYGGGTYRIVVRGPGKDGQRNRWYASCQETIGGEPKRLLQRADPGGGGGDGILGGDVQRSGTGVVDPPSIVQQAFKTISDTAKDERDRREVVEKELRDRLVSGDRGNADMIGLMREVFESRSRETTAALEARLAREREMSDERLKERDVQLDEIRREVRSSGGSVADTIREILPHVKGDGEASKAWLESVLAKHRDELQAIRDSHHREVESIRAAHQRELEATRDAHARGLEAERESSRNREQRLQDLVERERDERKRDHDQHKRYMDDQETRWKERLESQRERDAAHSESRFETMRNGLETQVAFLQNEIDRLRREIEDYRAKQQDAGDPESQIQKARALLDLSKDLAGGGGGITESIGGWDGMLKGIGDRFPEVLHALGNAVSGMPAAGGRPPQLVQTPQGPMVQTPQGLVPPRAAPMLGGGGPGPGPRPRRRVMPDIEEMYAEREMETEPRRLSERDERRPRYRPTRERVTTRGAREERGEVEERRVEPEREAEPERKSGVRRVNKQDATILSAMIEDAIEKGLEPEDWISEVAKEAPEQMMKSIASLSSEELEDAFAEHVPDSNVLSPNGKKFVRAALREVRRKFG